MPSYEYEISQSGDGAEPAWELTFDGRNLGRFGALEAALASARSLHQIDCRSGAHPTVRVATAYGKFRVNWLDGAPDSVQLDRIVEPSIDRARRSGSQLGR